LGDKEQSQFAGSHFPGTGAIKVSSGIHMRFIGSQKGQTKIGFPFRDGVHLSLSGVCTL
jgi:hypothetical protein